MHPGLLLLKPTANFNPQVFEDLTNGNEIALPNIGRETLHHVHAGDVAQAFRQAIASWPNAVGKQFSHLFTVGGSMIGYAEAVASYGRQARVRFLPWEERAEVRLRRTPP